MWQKCVVASSLQVRFGLNIDVVKTELEGFDPERDIPAGKQSEVFRILKEFLKAVKEAPSWFAQWKANRAEAMKAKLDSKNASAADDADKTKDDDGAEQKPEENTGADADVNGAAVAVADEGRAADDADAVAEFKVGDIVMGIATKSKEKWAQKCQIVEILTKQYKVTMLEGEAKNEKHKFLKACVKAIPAPVAPAPLAVASAEATVADAAPRPLVRTDPAPGAAPAPAQTVVDSEMRDVQDLFDS